MYQVSINSIGHWTSSDIGAGNGSISVKNLTSSTINNWVVHVTLTGITIGQCYDMTCIHSGNNYTISYNKSLGANKTITSNFSYTGSATFTVTTTDSNVFIPTPSTPVPQTPISPTDKFGIQMIYPSSTTNPRDWYCNWVTNCNLLINHND